jgi:hypothetical protein
MSALATRPQLALGSLCLLLLAAIVYEATAPLRVTSPASDWPATGRGTATVVLPVFRPPSSEAFSEINARPLFSRARAPIAPDAVVGVTGSSSSPPVAALVGVIIDGPSRLAMIRTGASPLASGVSVGDFVEGWKVAEIDSDKIVLRSGANSQEIRLDQNRASPGNASGPTPSSPGGAGATSTVAAPASPGDTGPQTAAPSRPTPR